MQVVDISTPASPVIVGSVSTRGPVRDVMVVGHYAYMADGDGLRVVDLSDPTSPVIIGGSATQGETMGVAAAGDRVYVADGNGGFVICPAQCEVPNPVQMILHEITTTDGTVSIAWETAFEIDHLGFHVERAEDRSDHFERLNRELIKGAGDRGHRYEFVDRDVRSGRTYAYKLQAVDTFGGTQMFDLGSVAVGSRLLAALILHQNRPNPFNPSTSIPFELPEDSHVRLTIYSVGGRLVRTLIDGKLAGDTYSVEWDGRDDQGHEARSGVYFSRLQAGDRTLTKQLVLLR
jgi:hypothetical protein